MTPLKPLPAGQQALTPYLIVKEPQSHRILQGGVRRRRGISAHRASGQDRPRRASDRGSRLMLADEYPDFGALSPASVGGYRIPSPLCRGRGPHRGGAAAAGATVLRPVKDEFYGDRTGMIAVPFGHKWQIATPVEDVSPAEMQRRWSATLA